MEENGCDGNVHEKNNEGMFSKFAAIRKVIEGVTLALLASLIFTCNGIIVQYFELDSVDVVAVRSFLQIIVLGLIMLLRGKSHQNVSDIILDIKFILISHRRIIIHQSILYFHLRMAFMDQQSRPRTTSR